MNPEMEEEYNQKCIEFVGEIYEFNKMFIVDEQNEELCKIIAASFELLFSESNLLCSKIPNEDQYMSIQKLRKLAINKFTMFLKEVLCRLSKDDTKFCSQVLSNQDKVGYRRAPIGDIKRDGYYVDGRSVSRSPIKHEQNSKTKTKEELNKLTLNTEFNPCNQLVSFDDIVKVQDEVIVEDKKEEIFSEPTLCGGEMFSLFDSKGINDKNIELMIDNKVGPISSQKQNKLTKKRPSFVKFDISKEIVPNKWQSSETPMNIKKTVMLSDITRRVKLSGSKTNGLLSNNASFIKQIKENTKTVV